MYKKSVIKFDERNPIHRHFKAYQERLIKHSDIDHKQISNARTRIVLGSYMRLEYPIEQIDALKCMEELGLIKRVSRMVIDIIPV